MFIIMRREGIIMDEELKKALAELSTKIDDLKKDNTRRRNLIRFESLGLASGALTLATLGLWFVKNNGAHVIAIHFKLLSKLLNRPVGPEGGLGVAFCSPMPISRTCCTWENPVV